jgi:serine/threonine protein kinase
MESGNGPTDCHAKRAHRRHCLQVAFSPDGKHLASRARPFFEGEQRDLGEIRIWDLDTRKAIVSINNLSPPACLPAYSPDGKRLASAAARRVLKVWDATSSGRPYFVMELVKGIPIIDYCDQQQLTARERLELFVSVCQAVQHAHGKGIIHRDLKPTNILVAPHDGVPVVKVIDFGVAKALGQRLTDKTIYTRFTQMIGTPLYMSPEQAEINALDVDIRSDVYSLGVLLNRRQGLWRYADGP